MIQNMGWQMTEWQMKHNHNNDQFKDSQLYVVYLVLSSKYQETHGRMGLDGSSLTFDNILSLVHHYQVATYQS